MRRVELLISCVLVVLGVWLLVAGAQDVIHMYVGWGPDVTVAPTAKRRMWLFLTMGWTSLVLAGLFYWYAPVFRRRRATPGGFPVTLDNGERDRD